ncbi:MAG TPA: hypothetical protein VML75_28265 [Kofleriaceae bacterium]|nr:hypothetical protein [Kofleriaceae bacterium]
MSLRATIFTLSLAALTACAGTAPRQAASGHPSQPASASYASEDYGGDSGGDSGGSYTASETARPQAPTERPGLGTVWGESVSSRVHVKSFVRESGSPFAAVAVHYNDAGGVEAQTRYLGAHALRPVRAFTPHGGISVALTDEHGNLLAGGEANGRTLVVGEHGRRYNIMVDNRTGGRYELVASVDGLDVVDGRPADLVKRGYIIEPYSSVVIDGFRQSNSSVAAFRFGRVGDSYAARTSGDRNVGVVGVAFFSERGSQWTSDELYRRDSANPFPGDRSYARPPH